MNDSIIIIIIIIMSNERDYTEDRADIRTCHTTVTERDDVGHARTLTGAADGAEAVSQQGCEFGNCRKFIPIFPQIAGNVYFFTLYVSIIIVCFTVQHC